MEKSPHGNRQAATGPWFTPKNVPTNLSNLRTLSVPCVTVWNFGLVANMNDDFTYRHQGREVKFIIINHWKLGQKFHEMGFFAAPMGLVSIVSQLVIEIPVWGGNFGDRSLFSIEMFNQKKRLQSEYSVYSYFGNRDEPRRVMRMI